MSITLNNQTLEQKLTNKANQLKIKVDELLEKFLIEKLEEDIQDIDFVSKKEEKDILKNLNAIPKEYMEIDKQATKIVNI